MRRALAAVLLAAAGIIGAPVPAGGGPGEAGELISRPSVSDVIVWQSSEAVQVESVAPVVPTVLSALTWAEIAGAGPDRFGYDYCPDFARPPPIESASDGYDTPTINTSDPAGERSWVCRVSLGLVVERSAPSATRGGVGPVRVGQAGEAAVRGAYDIGPKVTVNINGRTRILDGLTDSTVTEVKNVQSLSLTTQIQDNIAYAQQTGRRFDLYVRPDTYLTGPLQDAITDGDITLRFIP